MVGGAFEAPLAVASSAIRPEIKEAVSSTLESGIKKVSDPLTSALSKPAESMYEDASKRHENYVQLIKLSRVEQNPERKANLIKMARDEKIAGDELFNQADKTYTDYEKSSRDIAEPAINIGTLGLGASATKPISTAVTKTAEGVANVAEKASGAVADIGSAVAEKAKAVPNKLNEIAINNEKARWSKVTNVPKASYNKATEIFKNAKSQGHDISDTLSKGGLKLSDHIETSATGNKIFNTIDTAEKIHADASKISNDMLRPALEKADASGVVQRTPVNDVISGAIENIKKSKMTAEAKDKMIASLNETKISLEKQHPDGLSLTDLHDEKIIRDLNAKYSPVGDIATNIEATKNKAIADTARKMVEEKAPAEIPVKKFNEELSKLHQSANYLESLHGKPVPRTIIGNIARTASKVIGAGVGSGMGGGVLGGVGGYHIGGLVESLIENIPNPISIFRNLEKTNPEAFTKVQNYLNSLENNPSVAKPIKTANKKVTIK